MNRSTKKNSSKKQKEGPGDATSNTIDNYLTSNKEISSSENSPLSDSNNGMANMASPLTQEAVKTIITDALTLHTGQICERIDSLVTQLNSVTNRVDGIEATLKFKDQELSDTRQAISVVDSKLRKEIDDLQNRVLKSECYSRKRSLLLYGIPETENENTEEVRRFLTDILQLPDPDVKNMLFVNVHRLPRMPRPGTPQLDSPTPIIAKFVRVPDREMVLHIARKEGIRLRKGKYSVITDLPSSLKLLRGQLSRRASTLRTEHNVHARVFEKGTQIILQYRKSKDTPWIKLGLEEDPRL